MGTVLNPTIRMVNQTCSRPFRCHGLGLSPLLAPYPQLLPDPSNAADPYTHTLLFELML
jgi:hypothetical protein